MRSARGIRCPGVVRGGQDMRGGPQVRVQHGVPVGVAVSLDRDSGVCDSEGIRVDVGAVSVQFVAVDRWVIGESGGPHPGR